MAVKWRKSSYSGSSNDEMCVEVGELAGGVGIRDSRDADGARLELSGVGFASLVRKVKLGVLDRP
ncbi:DUF397 domain-containing protein [Actinomadura sp. NAK00032]|uniref:DUF397 domain-containing protein n=1 Tax=Actinomadura sp. NAK00032 TaxID=2742128 RepID=UPI0015924955|nr:DUF397 domain-containing protein [Actinomadura sp. NAK00032]QKW39107.1 DUF397 domain-containing protein [Actinomadura sp. NAK00032]